MIGTLAGHPDAAGALEACPCPADHDITVLWWDLQLAADDLGQATTAAGPARDGENPSGENAANARNAATRRNKNRKR